MTEINLDGGPIFVEIATDPPFPILYSQLIQDQNTNFVQNQDANVVQTQYNNVVPEVAKPNANTPEAGPSPSTEYLLNETQKPPDAESEEVKAFIKIEKRRFKCPECKRFTCETEEKMLRHVRKNHRGENPFQCYMCEYSTYNKAVFEEHVRVHQGIKPFKCSYCDYRSASKKNAKKHELIHRADNPLRCRECDFIGKNRKALQCHKNKEHSVKSEHECEFCKRKFTDAIKKHNHSKHKKKCSECTYITCSKMLFDSHLKFDHGIKIAKPARKDIRIFQCSLCPWSSNSKPRILLHLIHHPNQEVNEDVIDITLLRDCGIME